MSDQKWKWKNGRLHHPENPMISLSTDDAYCMQQRHPGIAAACKGVLKVYSERHEKYFRDVIEQLRYERRSEKVL